MKRSANRILTTHAGSLNRPDDLIELHRVEAPRDQLDQRLKTAVAEIVREQADNGVDIVNDGEFGRPMMDAVDYGAWQNYIFERLSGFEVQKVMTDLHHLFIPTSHDMNVFKDYYQSSAVSYQVYGPNVRMTTMVGTGPITYTGANLIARDIANFKAALKDVKHEDAIMMSLAPNSLINSEYYARQADAAYAYADALHQEVKAITDAGINVQLDDPYLTCNWDLRFYDKGWDEYRKWAEFHVELVNHVLSGIPEEKVRYHICWGSWHGPHSEDVPLKDIIDLVLKVRAQAYSVEAGNVRHEHEWQVWRDSKIPDGKILVPGVVSHATNVLEHPQVVADRIIRYADVVGRENVVASTDCGLGGRVHPQLLWAKVRALSEGAEVASERLWA
jgi:5-methyltetrahydropteroyltriglutamate--homocysteine methyltransferase